MPSRYNLPYEDITLTTSDRVKIRAYLLLHPAKSKRISDKIDSPTSDKGLSQDVCLQVPILQPRYSPLLGLTHVQQTDIRQPARCINVPREHGQHRLHAPAGEHIFPPNEMQRAHAFAKRVSSLRPLLLFMLFILITRVCAHVLITSFV